MGIFGALGDAAGAFLGHKAQKKQTKNIINDYNAAQEGSINALSGARDASVGYYQPYLEGGTNAFARAGQMQTPGFQYTPSDPSYQWRLSQGVDALDRSASARGATYSGGTLKALAKYGQDYASTEFDKDFGRNTDLARFGFQGAQGSAQSQSGYAAGVANSLFNGAQGRSPARTQRGNAIASQYGDVFGAGGDAATKALTMFFTGGA